jgi:DNA recombination protein RmuC
MIVSPTNLLMSLRTIASIWRYEYQNRNAQELVRQCTALYEKFVGFVTDVEEIGKRLGAAQQSYDDAHGKLTSGKGNLIRQVERIRELGLKPAKPLPAHLTEIALENESEAQVRSLPSSGH